MNMSSRLRTTLIWAALAATAAAVILAPPPDDTVQPARDKGVLDGLQSRTPAHGRASAPQPPPASAQPSSALRPHQRMKLGYEPKDLFHAEAPASAQRQQAARTRLAALPKPAAPPIPYVYMGRVNQHGNIVVFLTREEIPYVAQAGDILDGQYRIDAIKPPIMELTYLPLSQKQQLNIGPDQ